MSFRAYTENREQITFWGILLNIWTSQFWIKSWWWVFMNDVTCFLFFFVQMPYPSNNAHLKIILPHLGLKLLKLKQPPIISINSNVYARLLFQGWIIRQLNWSLLIHVYVKYMVEIFMFLYNCAYTSKNLINFLLP